MLEWFNNEAVVPKRCRNEALSLSLKFEDGQCRSMFSVINGECGIKIFEHGCYSADTLDEATMGGLSVRENAFVLSCFSTTMPLLPSGGWTGSEAKFIYSHASLRSLILTNCILNAPSIPRRHAALLIPDFLLDPHIFKDVQDYQEFLGCKHIVTHHVERCKHARAIHACTHDSHLPKTPTVRARFCEKRQKNAKDNHSDSNDGSGGSEEKRREKKTETEKGRKKSLRLLLSR